MVYLHFGPASSTNWQPGPQREVGASPAPLAGGNSRVSWMDTDAPALPAASQKPKFAEKGSHEA